jgi:hypothetical protein
MLPFPIINLFTTLAAFRDYYEQKNGRDAYNKLHSKVINSSSLAKLNGLSISQRRTPTTQDFRLLGSNMFLLGSVEKITLAALILLNEWNKQINSVYNFASQQTVDMLCRNIIAESRLTHL